LKNSICKLAVACLLLLFIAADEKTKDLPPFEPGEAIFNGKDLTGWEGDARLWSVRNGVLRGETTVEKAAAHNTFLIWRGGKTRDFVLKFKFHIRDGNSGVQYRSQEFGDYIVGGIRERSRMIVQIPASGLDFFITSEGAVSWLMWDSSW
jgi:hypothetical protein